MSDAPKTTDFVDPPQMKNAPTIDLGSFKWGVTSDADKEPPSKLGVLGLLENKTFKGPGFNTIFRPRSRHPLEGEPEIKGDANSDNDLQLNLTVESLTFSSSIGRIPNRGLFDQPDIVLAGLTYMDTVQDVTNKDSGLGDNKDGKGIHNEPGVWLAIPATPKSAEEPHESQFPNATLCRMASIPHGVTINAQGVQPPLTPIPGKPDFGKVRGDFGITPFNIGFPDEKLAQRRFTSQDVDSVDQNRTPSNLELFQKNGTITQEILDNPNLVLKNAIKSLNQNIIRHIRFTVDTDPTKDFDGGGTTNIDFLGPRPKVQTEEGEPQKNEATATKPHPPANAFVPSMTATFWVETVEYKFTAKAGNDRDSFYRPAGDFGPTYVVPPTTAFTEDIPYTVWYTQLQYSQMVLLNFATLSWPHVSVATLGEQTTFNLMLPPVPTKTGSGPEPPGPITEPKIPKGPDVGNPDPKAPEVIGKWDQKFDLKNVAVHASLLPTGKVLYWGRRSCWKTEDVSSMSEHETKTFIWDPVTKESKPTATHPTLTTGNPVNLFCSGHCFQPDGNLFIVGGHLEDNHGVNQACVYNPFKDTWTARPRMNYGRWYPSALTLNDGSALAISGSYYDDTDNSTPMNDIPQIWRKDEWISVPRMNDAMLQSYPRLHLDPHGRIFMAGPQAQSQYFDEGVDDGVGAWTTDGPARKQGSRDYAPSVMYENGKVMYIGGGMPATNVVEFIDLHELKPEWSSSPSSNMTIARRQHNATILPDGTVLVTGGTSGIGPNNDDFNDVAHAVHAAELWNPSASSQQWTRMAEEDDDRCYHSIALLLPNGQVLSAGSGEWGIPIQTNQHSHISAQLYSPPYLFKGPRPTIVAAPDDINYNEKFEVTVGASDAISKVSWIRLGSVTHACNMNQSLTFLTLESQLGTTVSIHAPADPHVTPPGHYMLFLLSENSLPSDAKIIAIGRHGTVRPPRRPRSKAHHGHKTARPKDFKLSLPARNEKIIAAQDRSPVAVGITARCPYGLGSCWGAAHDGLQNIDDIEIVRPVPDQDNSIAFVYLKNDIVPDFDIWQQQFQKSTHKLYHMRGIEMSLSGPVTKRHMGTDEQLVMLLASSGQEVALTPFYPSSKLEWDRFEKKVKDATEEELGAWAKLSAELEPIAKERRDHFKQEWPIQVDGVAGTLRKHDANKFSLDVRRYAQVVPDPPPANDADPNKAPRDLPNGAPNDIKNST